MAHFEVGKKVIAIKNHSQGEYRKGDIFLLQGIKQSKCCKRIVLDIGKSDKNHLWGCGECKVTSKSTDGVWWFNSISFIPYDDSLSEITADELIEQLETELILN